jgi:hypothetical protein
VLYRVLNEHWGEERFSDIVEAIHAHVHFLFTSETKDRFRNGIYHLVAMVYAEYRGAEQFLGYTVPRVRDVDVEEAHLPVLLRRALKAVVAYNRHRQTMHFANS